MPIGSSKSTEAAGPGPVRRAWRRGRAVFVRWGPVVVPLLYQTALMYRSPSATNVYINEAYGMYDYAMIGSNN